MEKARRGLVIAAMALYLLLNIAGELLRWDVPVWAGVVDIVVGLLLLYWACKAFEGFVP